MEASRSTELEGFVFPVEVIVDQPFLPAVDGDHRAATARIERQRHPGGLAHQAEQAGRMDIGRLHALDDRRSLQICVDRLANDRTRAVAAHDEIGMKLRSRRVIEVADGGNDAVVLLAEILERRAVQNLKSVDGSGMREKHGFHVDLVDAVRRLGRRPAGVRSTAWRYSDRAGRGFVCAKARCRLPWCGRNNRSGSRAAVRCHATCARVRAAGRSPSNVTRRGCISRSVVRRQSVFPRRLRIFLELRGPSPALARLDRLRPREHVLPSCRLLACHLPPWDVHA